MGKKDSRSSQDTKVMKTIDEKQNQRAREETQSGGRAWRIVRISLFSVGSLVVLGIGSGAGYITSLMKGLPKVNAATFVNNSAASIVYDRNGDVIARFKGDGDRQPISSLSQVSPDLVNSFVAAEDKTFFTNIGINPLSMGRAFIQDIAGHRIESGASTITQQTVKLAVFPEQQRTLRRKVQEIALALEVNHELTKSEIMTDYMNWVYMGRMGTDTVYGVKRASEIMFGKDPLDLTLAQASFLAAIPNNPSLFSPYQFPTNTIQRQHYILDQMLHDKLITQAQYNQAYRLNVVKELRKPPSAGLPSHPYLVLDEIKPRVIQDLVKAGVYANANDAESALPTAGLKIYTTIDLKDQNDVEKTLGNAQLFAGTDKTFVNPNGSKTTDLYEAGFTLIDNQTGGILAVGGGRNYLQDEIDHADIARQPGSSIKPLLDYGPAIDQGELTAGSVLYDAPTQFALPGGQAYTPKDDEPDFVGLISARAALYESRNVPAIDVLNTVTPQVGFSYLNKMGLGVNAKTLDGQPTIVADDMNHLGAAIGGLDNGVTVEQMTSAYTTFPNQGVWHQSYMISKITDDTGQTVYQVQPATNQVFSPATAYIITDMLHDVLYHAYGTAQLVGYHFPGQYISGKTGTTDAQRDGWFLGYTPTYTAGIWMGYNHNEPIDLQNYNLKFTLWNDIMTPVLAKNPSKTPWPNPGDVVRVKVSSISGMLPTSLSTAHGTIDSEPYLNGTQPTQTDNVDVLVKYVVIHGKDYLATTNTPASEVKTGVFIKLPNDLPDMAHKIPNGITDQSQYYVPTEADPRGGRVLDAGSLPGETNPAQLATPTGFTGQLSGNAVSLSWNAVNGATTYEIYRATDPNGPYTSLGSASDTTFTDPSLPTGATDLYYEIAAQSKSALSDTSAPLHVSLLPNSSTTNDTNSTSNSVGNVPGLGFSNGLNDTTTNGISGSANSTNASNSVSGTPPVNTPPKTTNTTTQGTSGHARANTTNGSKVNRWVPGFGPSTDSARSVQP